MERRKVMNVFELESKAEMISANHDFPSEIIKDKWSTYGALCGAVLPEGKTNTPTKPRQKISTRWGSLTNTPEGLGDSSTSTTTGALP